MFQDSIILQQQLNVAKNVIKRLQKSLTFGSDESTENPLSSLSVICTDKVKLVNEFLIESLLGTSYVNGPLIQVVKSSETTTTFSVELMSDFLTSECSKCSVLGNDATFVRESLPRLVRFGEWAESTVHLRPDASSVWISALVGKVPGFNLEEFV